MPVLHFAGIALAGNYAESAANFPYSSKIIANPLQLNLQLATKLQSTHFANFKVSLDLGDVHTGDALGVALVVTWENVGQESFPGFTKVFLNLQAEALVFNFKTKQIVSSFPFGAEYIDALPHQQAVSPAKIEAEFRALYLRKASGILDQFVQTMRAAKLPHAGALRIQVAAASLSPAAAQTLGSYGVSTQKGSYLLLSSFERYLSANCHIPVLPHANNQAIGGVMAARFADGSVFQFHIPQPDYVIRLSLQNARRVEISRTASERALAYAAYLKVVIDQPLSPQPVLSASFKYAAVKVLALGASPDNPEGFQEAIFSICDQVTRDFAAPNPSWEDKWVTDEQPTDALSTMPALMRRFS